MYTLWSDLHQYVGVGSRAAQSVRTPYKVRILLLSAEVLRLCQPKKAPFGRRNTLIVAAEDTHQNPLLYQNSAAKIP